MQRPVPTESQVELLLADVAKVVGSTGVGTNFLGLAALAEARALEARNLGFGNRSPIPFDTRTLRVIDGCCYSQWLSGPETFTTRFPSSDSSWWRASRPPGPADDGPVVPAYPLPRNLVVDLPAGASRLGVLMALVDIFSLSGSVRLDFVGVELAFYTRDAQVVGGNCIAVPRFPWPPVSPTWQDVPAAGWALSRARCL